MADCSSDTQEFLYFEHSFASNCHIGRRVFRVTRGQSDGKALRLEVYNAHHQHLLGWSHAPLMCPQNGTNSRGKYHNLLLESPRSCLNAHHLVLLLHHRGSQIRPASCTGTLGGEGREGSPEEAGDVGQGAWAGGDPRQS